MLKKPKSNFFIRISLILTFLVLVFGIFNIPFMFQGNSATLLNDNFSIQSNTGIIINEVYSGTPEWVELINRGSDRNLAGWKLLMYRSPSWIGDPYVYYFPSNFIFKQNSLVIIQDSAGSDTETTLYTGGGRNSWTAAGLDMASLLDESNHSIDHVEWNGWPGPTPPGTIWSGSLSSSNRDYLYRNKNLDTNSATDWTSATSGSPLQLNPGQSISLGDILISINIVLNASIFLSEVKVASSVPSGDYLSLSCRITSPLNITNVVALIQNAEFQIINIIKLDKDGIGIYRGNWLSANSPFNNYYVNFLAEDNESTGKIFENAATFSIVPSFLSQYGLLIWIIIGLSIFVVECLLLIRYRPSGLGTQVKSIFPKWKKTGQTQAGPPKLLQHKSGERPYNKGISLNSCPSCKKDLPGSTKKQLELGYRVYCPYEGCFYPLNTITTGHESTPEPFESQTIKQKAPDASKAFKIQEKVPESARIAKPAKPLQAAVPPKTAATPKGSGLKECPYCKQPLSDTQLKLKQTGKKVMCRKCLELI